MRSFRLVKREYQDQAFTGIGSILSAQRWNSKGVPVVYTTGSLPLAILEVLVNLNTYRRLSEMEMVVFQVEFEPELIIAIKEARLPAEWKSYPYSKSSQLIGDKWFKEKESPVLAVPSAVVNQEYNYLINPLHKDFDKLVISGPIDFSFDPRLSK